jgi:hypothetical protein
VWGIFETTIAMTRMYDLTHKQKYLDHLRAVNEKVLFIGTTSTLATTFRRATTPAA